MELLLPINVVAYWVTHVPFYVLILRCSYERYSKVNFILSLPPPPLLFSATPILSNSYASPTFIWHLNV